MAASVGSSPASASSSSSRSPMPSAFRPSIGPPISTLTAPGWAISRARRSSATVSTRSRHGVLRSASASWSTRPSSRSTSAVSTAALSGK